MIKNIVLFGILIVSLLFPFKEATAQGNDNEPKFRSEISGNFRIDYRYFPEKALYPGQHQEYWSGYFQPEVYLEWDRGNQMVQFTGFGRLDQYDTKSSHVDLREFYYKAIIKKFEVSVGFKKVFWGVTESNHVVDVINQSDALEGFDIEQKLGQPMLHLSLTQNWGVIDFHLMSYFRQMRFPGTMGRPRPPAVLDYDLTTYESDQGVKNIDLAVRWSHSFGAFDTGLSHFYGTSRPPIFVPRDSAGTSFNTHYELINQTSFDLQAYTGSMLWKLEAMYRQSNRKDIIAYVIGGEYTFSNMFRSGADLGVILEYNYDDRGVELITALDDDVFFGLRLAVNDRQSTNFLGGIIMDANNQTLRYTIKADRRFGDSWNVSIEAVGFENVDESEFIYLLRNDTFLRIGLKKYF